MKAKKSTDKRRRVELCDWNDTLHASAIRKGDHVSAKAKCRGEMTETEIAKEAGLDPEDVERLLVAVGSAIRKGYDVRLCEAVRFYACVHRLKTPFIATQTIGSFRRSIADKTVRLTREGRSITRREILELDREARQKRLHVSPDSLVTCPKCGTEFRVGRSLG